MTFNEPVTVNTTSGRPQLTLANGGVAVYTAGSGSTTLTFDYTVAGGQSTTDLDYGSAGALGLVGGTIKNAGGHCGRTDPAVHGQRWIGETENRH